MSRIRANLLLLLTGAVWGMGFVAQSTAMSGVGPWTYTAARFLLATLTLLPFALWEWRRASRPLPPRDVAGFALCGAMLFAGTILQQLGILTTSVTSSGFLTGLYVVMTPAVALLLLRRRVHWVVWPAAAVALFGLLLAGGGRLEAIGAGDRLTIVGAAGFAFQIVLVGVFATASGRPLTLSCVQFATVALLAGIGTPFFETPETSGLLSVWAHVVYGGCISAGLAFTLQTVGQRWTTAPQAAIFLSSEAVFAALFGALLLGERMAPVGYLGCVMILASMLAVELVPLRWPARGANGRMAANGGATGR